MRARVCACLRFLLCVSAERQKERSRYNELTDRYRRTNAYFTLKQRCTHIRNHTRIHACMYARTLSRKRPHTHDPSLCLSLCPPQPPPPPSSLSLSLSLSLSPHTTTTHTGGSLTLPADAPAPFSPVELVFVQVFFVFFFAYYHFET